MIGLPFLTSEDKPACMENPSLFYDDDYVPEDDHIITRAGVKASQDAQVRRVCGECPFRTDCLDWAIRHEKYGHWAGTTPAQREEIRRAWGIQLDTPHVVWGGTDWVERERIVNNRRQVSRLAEREKRERLAEWATAVNVARYGQGK